MSRRHSVVSCLKVLCLVSITFLSLNLISCAGTTSATNASSGPLAVTNGALAIVTKSLANATSGTAYSATLVSTGGLSPITWQLTAGQLPSGLSLSPGGNISGIPAAVGQYTFTARAADSSSPPSSVTTSLNVAVDPSALALSVPLMPPAVQGVTYNSGNNTGNGGAVVNISGGSAPYKCTVASGALPSGMSMSEVTPSYAAGLCIALGIPTAAGDFTFTVQVADGASDLATQSVTLVVKSSNLPTISAVTAASVSSTSEMITWTTNVAASSRVCYSNGTYDVDTCTPEQDPGGVTSHSVTLTGLRSSYNFQYFVVSRGISGGAPQDYLTNTDAGSGCCRDTFSTAAPSAGTLDFSIQPSGPHNVIQGYPLIVGIYYWPTVGASPTPSIRFIVGGIPANSKVHWPDQQDNGFGQGSVSTTNTPDDTLTMYGMGGSNEVEFEIQANQGGITPLGNYTLTITATTSTSVTHAATWPLTVKSTSFQFGNPASYPAIPYLSLWQSNMTTYGDGNYRNGLQANGSACSYAYDQCIHYYDGQSVYYQIGTYAANRTYWDVGAANSRSLYHQYIAATSGNVPGYWVFPHGLYFDCVYNSNITSCSDLHALTNAKTALLADINAFFEVVNSRETCYALGAKRLDYNAGGSSTLAQVQQLATHCIGHADRAANGLLTVGGLTTGYEQAFMDGLMAQALIEYYMDPKTGNQSDARVPDAVKALADHLWSSLWVPWAGANGHFLYNLLQYEGGIPVEYGGNDWQALNSLIAPMYAWLYRYTGQQQYQLEGDAIWASGVNDPPGSGIGWSGKNFSQQYRWTFDYVSWRQGH